MKDGAGDRRSWETGKELRTGDGEGHEGGGKREKEIKGMTIFQKKVLYIGPASRYRGQSTQYISLNYRFHHAMIYLSDHYYLSLV
jgi:hypothetical protein